MKEFVISKAEEGGRLERYLQKRLPLAPRNFLFKMIRKKNITLNGARTGAGEVLRAGDTVRIYFSDETYEKFGGASNKSRVPEQNALEDAEEKRGVPKIIHEDDDILIIDKPAGLLTQKGEKSDYSLNDWLMDYLTGTGAYDPAADSTFRPSAANRLDRNTSGIVAAGKTKKGLMWLSEGFRDHTITKYYVCAVLGKLERRGEIKGYLVKNEKTNTVRFSESEIPGGLWSETIYRPEKVFGSFTTVRVKLVTGRKHQIRVHMAHIGHPILGDYKYGDREANALIAKKAGIRAQMLHCFKIDLPDGRVYECGPPEEFAGNINRLEDMC